MAPYNTLLPPPALAAEFPCNQFLVWNAEAVLAGEYSQQLHMAPGPTSNPSRGLRIILDFSAAPGTFEFDVMEDDTDLQGAAHYAEIPVAAVINALNSGSATQATLDLLPFQGQFFCLYCKTAPSNSGIKVTATVTRV